MLEVENDRLMALFLHCIAASVIQHVASNSAAECVTYTMLLPVRRIQIEDGLGDFVLRGAPLPKAQTCRWSAQLSRCTMVH